MEDVLTPISKISGITPRKLPGSVAGQWHEQQNAGRERYAEPKEPTARECECPGVPQRRPHKEPRGEEHQRHEEYVVEVLGIIKELPAGRIDYWRGGFEIIGGVKMRKGRVGEATVMGDDHQDYRGFEVVESHVPGMRCQVGDGSQIRGGRGRVHGGGITELLQRSRILQDEKSDVGCFPWTLAAHVVFGIDMGLATMRLWRLLNPFARR